MTNPYIPLAIINAIAFAIFFACLVKLAPIAVKAITAKRSSQTEIQILGQPWKVNYWLITITTLPFAVFTGLAGLYIWIIARIINKYLM